MKRVLALLMALSLLCLAACGKKTVETPTETDTTIANTEAVSNEEQPTQEKDTVSNDKITMEELLNAPESPIEDFDVVDQGGGIVYLQKYLGDDEVVVFPESLGITYVGKYVFANDFPVKAVRMSNSVAVIERGAFGLNNNLQLVACGEGLEKIGPAVFQNDENLREVKLYDGLVSIDEYAFSGCSNLKEIYISATATDIYDCAIIMQPDDFVIVGEAGSAAEVYAQENGIQFRAK